MYRMVICLQSEIWKSILTKLDRDKSMDVMYAVEQNGLNMGKPQENPLFQLRNVKLVKTNSGN